MRAGGSEAFEGMRRARWALLAVAIVACGDDGVAAVDGGPDVTPFDAGPDLGDGGRDAGPDAPRLRLAHLVPGAPPLHLCVHAIGIDTAFLVTRNGAGVATPLPYRGVSGYVTSLALLPIEHDVRAYDAAVIDGICPAPGATAPSPLFTATLDASRLIGGRFYTLAAIGLLDGRDATAPQLLVLEDELTPPPADRARVRLVHAIPNLPPEAASVDVCFDPAGPSPAVELFDDVSFADATRYQESAPLVAGLLSVHAHNPTGSGIPNCLAMPPPAGTLLLRTPIPFPVPSGAGIPANLVGTFAADTIDTAFAVGDVRRTPLAATPCSNDADCAAAIPLGQSCNAQVGVCTHPLGPTLIPWRDDLGLPAR